MIRVPYDKMQFVWISDHWDIHLKGLCRLNGKLMRFETPIMKWQNQKCHVYSLTRFERVRWLIRKYLFEICVGEHWTYPQRRQGKRFHVKKPRWFHRLIMSMYYRKWIRWI